MLLSTFTHLLFDLDHTLWDFERNSEETLRELFRACELNKSFTSEDHFLNIYHTINATLWGAYGRGKISKNKVKYDRFGLTLKKVGIVDSSLIEFMAEEYVLRSPCKTHLMTGALEVLEILSEKYKIIIVTNGFSEVQYRKIKMSGLEPFVDQVIISEDAGFQKPDSRFFDYLVQKTKVLISQGLMIGDNLQTDILGAKDYGFQTVFFNPDGKKDTVGATFEVRELRAILGLV